MAKSAGQGFLKNTKYENMDEPDQAKGKPSPPIELEHDKKAEIIDLPDLEPGDVEEIGLKEAIAKRESRRDYTKEPLSLKELSFLLWCTQGIKEVLQGYVTLRAVPSAGARHAFETDLLANNVTGLEPGLYRYLAIDHKLTAVNKEETLSRRAVQACLGQEMVADSAVMFIWTAVTHRMTWRYGERGYRYLFLDAGHVCQNLYLAAEAIQSGVCAIGAYSDDQMNKLLGIGGKEQFVIYMATVGKI